MKKVLKLLTALLVILGLLSAIPVKGFAIELAANGETVSDNDPDNENIGDDDSDDRVVANGFYISFLANKPENCPDEWLSGEMEEQFFSFDTSENDVQALSENQFTLTHYVFKGWHGWSSDGKEYYFEDKAEISCRLLTTKGDHLVLRAVWEPGTYEVAYSLGGSANNPNATTISIEDKSGISLKNPSRTGYEFLGWYTESSFTNKVTSINLEDVSAFYANAENAGKKYTLYAKWQEIKYNIRFSANGGKGSMNQINNISYLQTVKLTSSQFTRKGYTFLGWNTKADGKGTKFDDLQKVSKLTLTNGATVTLYAQWKPITYTVTYKNMEGAKNNASNPKKFNVTYATIKLKSPTRKGYTFKGWYSNSKLTKRVTAIESKTVGNVVLYAKWEVNTYSVKFKANGGKGKMTAKTNIKYNKKFKLPANKFTRAGYEFAGWNTKADGSGKSYANGAKVSKLTEKNGKTVNLYAQWKKASYNIKFDGNGATSGKMKVLKYVYFGKTYQLPANKFKRNGYKFVGWNTQKDGSGEGYLDQQKIKDIAKNSGTLVLYARWVRINNNNYDAQAFFNYFVKQELTKQGSAGLLGNLYAESGLVPNNLQNTFNKSLGMTDEEYTNAVDSGAYKNFVYDSAGYGLAQWTSSGRKQALLNYARAKEASIGDVDMQLEFLIYELAYNYNSVYDVLIKTNSVKAASNKVLLDFERPKDQSEAAQKRRAAIGTNYFKTFCPNDSPEPGELPMRDEDCPFTVQTSVTLNVRSGAGTENGIVKTIPAGSYVIVHVAAGNGSAKGWGQLEGGGGWIALDYAKRIK